MKFVIVTGMSGAGKSTVLKYLEDIGYFCVDNLPVNLITKFAELCYTTSGNMSDVAIGVDIRSGENLANLNSVFHDLKKNDYGYKILFLDCNDQILIKRYKETRRIHPLAHKNGIEEGITKEREKLKFIRDKSEYIIDTSMLLTKELKKEIERIFTLNQNYKNIFITIMSFGFKYGIPSDADLVFDVRFMPNPYYISDLKDKTGNDAVVQNYVMNSDISIEFDSKLKDMIKFLIPNYIQEGKNQLVICIGCTGGHHRSVTIANRLYEELSKDKEYGLKIEHRDILK